MSEWDDFRDTIITSATSSKIAKHRSNTKTGVELISEERLRQINSENWTAEHDDSHKYGLLAKRAAELAVCGTDAGITDWLDGNDGWGLVRKHKNNRVRQLVIAGALLAAEIDRLQRASICNPSATNIGKDATESATEQC